MHPRRSSAAGSRFLTLVREWRGLEPSARAARIGKATGYRWLREAFAELRAAGVGVAEAQQQLGFTSPLVLDWECESPPAPAADTIWRSTKRSRTASGFGSMPGPASATPVVQRA